MTLTESDRKVGVLKCDAHLRPGGLLRNSLDTHIIILGTLACLLKKNLFSFISFVSFLT